MNVEEHPRRRGSEHSGASGSMRQTVVLAAKRYKSSWVDLGKLLVQVRDQAMYEEWGFPNFEAYCLAELRIRKQTAMKLTRNFSFLDKHEPERMQGSDIVERAPAFEVVEVLAQAEERGQLSAQEYKSIRDSIWNQERPVSELRREVVEKFPPPEPEPLSGGAALRRLVGLAKKLSAEVHGTKHVPKAVGERVDALVEDLESLLAAKAKA